MIMPGTVPESPFFAQWLNGTLEEERRKVKFEREYQAMFKQEYLCSPLIVDYPPLPLIPMPKTREERSKLAADSRSLNRLISESIKRRDTKSKALAVFDEDFAAEQLERQMRGTFGKPLVSVAVEAQQMKMTILKNRAETTPSMTINWDGLEY
jgi:hypothetical protein